VTVKPHKAGVRLVLNKLVRSFLWVIGGIMSTLLILGAAMAVISTDLPIKPRSGYGISDQGWDQGHVWAAGTWTLDAGRLAFPIQTSEIRCLRDEKTCWSAQAEITFSDTLNVELDRYPISRWDKDVVVFQSEAHCVRYVYTISRANRRLVGTRTTKEPRPEGCGGVDAAPLQMAMADGFTLWLRLRDEAGAKVWPFAWIAVGLCWSFVLFRVWRSLKPAT
jgi:hypothetical protein